jgi:hypothetical protein
VGPKRVLRVGRGKQVQHGLVGEDRDGDGRMRRQRVRKGDGPNVSDQQNVDGEQRAPTRHQGELRCSAGLDPRSDPVDFIYDVVLRLEMPVEVRLVAFADDLAVMAMAATTDDLMNLVDGALEWVNEWMRGAGLRLAARKTEAVLLTGKRRPGRVTFHMGGEEIV